MAEIGHRHETPRDGAAAPGSAPRAVGRGEPLARREHRIARLTESEVVPRLVLAGRGVTGLPASAPSTSEIAPAEIDRLVDLLVQPDGGEIVPFVRAVHARGVPLTTLYATLLVPAARRLGTLWESDRCVFAAVTVGIWRLEHVLREFAGEFEQTDTAGALGRSILLAACPGEDHAFAISVVAQYFRRAGWDVLDEPSSAQPALCQLVREQWFDVVGLSLACDARIEQLASTALAMRRASRNRSLRILVGGRVFVEHPDWVSRVGADATARDAAHAVEQAGALVSLLSATAA